ncbi:MAG TPA: universal stress protein [Thermoanaerobaculia bacterium]|nr:universal stress protein [Thermoanaerobaculia bacterium]
MRLLVGFDRRDGGRDALALTCVLGSRERSSAVVATVMPYDPFPVSYQELMGPSAAEAAEPAFEEAREKLDGLEVETRAFGGGSAAGILTDLAERESFDAIAIGSSHRGPVGRALLGSVGRGVLHGAPCPVVVAPHGYAGVDHGPFGLIAVAYDGTAESKLALDRARGLAEAHGARIRLLTVESPVVAPPGIVGYTPVEPPDPRRVLAAGVEEVGARVEVEGDLLGGPVAETLAGACEDGVDLLVAGSRGYGPLSRVLLGSVTTKLIGIAPCPVLVVPRR